MTKQELAQLYNISAATLRKLLNKRYYLRLKEAGYEKQDQFISPKVYRIFRELYGEPITENND